MVTEQSHGQYLLLLRVTNVKDPDIDRFAKQIHEAYMTQYGSAGAITVAVLKLGEIFKAGTNAQ